MWPANRGTAVGRRSAGRTVRRGGSAGPTPYPTLLRRTPSGPRARQSQPRVIEQCNLNDPLESRHLLGNEAGWTARSPEPGRRCNLADAATILFVEALCTIFRTDHSTAQIRGAPSAGGNVMPDAKQCWLSAAMPHAKCCSVGF